MAEGNRSPSVDDNEENITEVVNFNGTLSPSTAVQRGKRDRLGQLDEAEVVPLSFNSLRDEHNKKAKRELPSDSLSSPNSTLKGKRHQRNYRPRVMESSSEDETNSSNVPNSSKEKDISDLTGTPNSQNVLLENCNSVSGAKVESVDVSANETLSTLSNSNTSNPTAISERNDNTDQSSSNVSSRSQDTEASSASQMETVQSSSPTSGSAAQNSESTPTGCRRMRRFFSNFPLDSNSDDSLDEEDNEDSERRERDSDDRATRKMKLEESVTKELNVIMGKCKPKHKWNCLQAVLNRQYGMPGNRQAPVLFTNRYYDSLHVVQRLSLVSKLDFHNGCTNALNFNDCGDLLASSSDDLQIAIWDWTKKKTLITYNSGHRNNVFQCKFLPLSGNTHIASCARDGQVRLAELSATGVCKDTRRLAKHSRSAHKLTIRVNNPYELMSAGEDAFVYNIDIRANQPDKIVLVKDVHGNRVPLYSIHQHPLNDDQFCVSGQDEYVRVYDRRIISPLGPPVLKYCPNHLVEKKPKSNITCAVYSNNGDGILASYNDEDIYFFDTSLSEGAEPAHRYSGHRNSSTVKGVNFFSPSSQFVVSGSDCGNIFIWDRETEAIVNCMPGDENGVVNVLEPHPHLPVLATSGLDNEIKMWVPTLEEEPKLTNLQKTVRSNVLRRLHESMDDAQQGLDTHMLMVLFQHLRRSSNLRGRPRSGSGQGGNPDDDDVLGILDSSDTSSDSSSDGDADDSDDSDPSHRGDVVQCSTH